MSQNSKFLRPIMSLGIAMGSFFSKHRRIAQGILTVSAKDWGTSQEKSIRIEDTEGVTGSRLEHALIDTVDGFRNPAITS